MKKLLNFLDRHFEELLMALLLIVITVVLFLQVVLRYCFGYALSWPEELSRYCFVYFTFLTFGFCTRRNSMLKLDILEMVLPKAVWKVLQFIICIVSIAFFAYMFRYSLDLVAAVAKTSRTSTALGIPYTIIYSSSVIGFALGLIRSIQMLILFVLKKEEKEGNNV